MQDHQKEWLLFLAFHVCEMEDQAEHALGYARIILEHVDSPSEWYGEVGEAIRRQKRMLGVGLIERQRWFDFLAEHESMSLQEVRNFSFGFCEVAHDFLSKITPCCKKRQKRARGYIESYKPHAKTRALLDQARAVLDEYRAYWPLTCRQVFYRMVGAHAYDKSEAAYGRLCHHLANARRARLIPFHAIRDDGVSTYHRDHFVDHDDFLRHVRHLGEGYTRDKLAGQDIHLEVWCEAAGMLPQLDDVAEPYSVRAYSSGGFDSLTAKKQLADRICRIGKPAVILHLGDYDPSGVSIFDSVAEDVAAFVAADRPWATVDVTFERIALTADQVRRYELPTAPAKATDTRSKSWAGGTCQLEALPPNIIADILREAIERHIDHDQLALDEEREKHERVLISGLLPSPEANR